MEKLIPGKNHSITTQIVRAIVNQLYQLKHIGAGIQGDASEGDDISNERSAGSESGRTADLPVHLAVHIAIEKGDR